MTETGGGCGAACRDRAGDGRGEGVDGPGECGRECSGQVLVEPLPPRTWRVDVVVSEATLRGADNEPGELVGYGPITAQTARRLAGLPTHGIGNLLDAPDRSTRPQRDAVTAAPAMPERPAPSSRSAPLDGRHAAGPPGGAGSPGPAGPPGGAHPSGAPDGRSDPGDAAVVGLPIALPPQRGERCDDSRVAADPGPVLERAPIDERGPLAEPHPPAHPWRRRGASQASHISRAEGSGAGKLRDDASHGPWADPWNDPGVGIRLRAVWRRLVTDPRSGIVRDYGTTRYRPPAALADLVRARDRYCYAPGCRQPAARCDLDHVLNSPAGPSPRPDPDGATADHNLGPGCAYHHRTKARPGWRVTTPAPGVFDWTTPTGHTYRRDAQPPLDPPVYDEIPF